MTTGDSMTERQFEKHWWESSCDKCKNCVHDCKQSSKIDNLYCPNFKLKEEI